MALRRISLMGLILPMAVFAQNPEVLINPQGLARQDLSIRGSSYTGTGISINGINLKVPYSAHYTAELPVYGSLLSDPRARTGGDTVSGSLIGTSALRTQPLALQSMLNLGIGTEERYRASAFSSTDSFGGYIDWERAGHIDYDANDLDRLTAGAAAQVLQNDWQIDLLSAGQRKRNGAQGYYGIPANTFAEEQTDDVLLLASAVKGDMDGSFMRTGLNLREFEREYRIPDSVFERDTRSRYGSAMVEGRTLEIQNLALHVRADLEHERIRGDIGNHNRTRGSVLIRPEAHYERFTIKAGMNSVFQSDESAEWLPQAGIDFLATDNIKLYAACTETVQQPDFQTLYDSDPYHIANSDLPLVRARNTELGLHQFLSAQMDWRAAVFHRRMEGASDWVKASAADTTWTAMDLGTLDVIGIDAKITYLASDNLNLQLYYQWIEKDEYDVYAGLYELDYPEHLLAMSGFWQVTPEFRMSASQVLRYQPDSNIRTGNDFGSFASLGLQYAPRFAKNVRLSLLVENLWGSNFQPIPGLKPRPASFSTGITVTW